MVMQCGDIIFVRGHGFLDKAIRFFDKGEFNHVAIAVSKDEILEAQYGRRSKIVEFADCGYDDCEIVDLGLSDEQRARVKEIAPTLVGKYYDYIQILEYVINKIFCLNLSLNNPHFLICSELVQIILTTVDLLPKEMNVIDLTPNQLYDVVKWLQRVKLGT